MREGRRRGRPARGRAEVVRGVVTGTVVAAAVTGGAVVAGACVVRVFFGATAATFGDVVVDGSSEGTTAVERGTRDDETAWTAS